MNDLEEILTPADYGPVMWGGLHTLAADVNFAPQAWLGYVMFMRGTLSPAYSPSTGCAECWGHFEAWCEEKDPAGIMTAAEARRWGWQAHNLVRFRQGKSMVSFEEAAARWDW